MASGGAADMPGASAAVSVDSNKSKIKRTPVILNYPRKPDVAHFRVLQWNVLADGLAQNGDFCMAPPGCLEWEYRRPLLLQEILEANADIICLQELNHFDELNQVLSGLGYEGAFREKHASPALKYEYPPDGMAVFFRKGRFQCCANGVEGRSFLDDSTGREQSQGFLQILLYDMVVGREILIVTTHLKAKDGAECEGLRMQQANQLLRHVEGTLQRLKADAAANTHIDNGAGNGSAAGSAAGAAAAGGSRNGGPCANGNGNGSSKGSASGGAVAAAASNGNGAGTQIAKGASCDTNGNGSTGTSSGGGSSAHREVEGSPVSGVGGGGGGSVTDASTGPALQPNRQPIHSRVRSWPVPVVITGDFNTMPGSKTCEAFRRHPLGLSSLWEQRPLEATLSSGSDMELAGLPLLLPVAPPPSSPPAPAAASTEPTQQRTSGPTAASEEGGSGSAAGAAAPAAGPGQQQQRMAAAAAAMLAADGSAAASGSSGDSGSGPGACSGPGRPEFSTWKFRVKGESKRISDYIYFSGCGQLRPLQRWRMLTEEEIGPGALPSAVYGSDHVSMCCEFEWDVDADLEWAPASREADWG